MVIVIILGVSTLAVIISQMGKDNPHRVPMK